MGGQGRFSAYGTILSILLVCLLAISTSATDRKPEPQEQPVDTTDFFPAYMSIEEAAEYEYRIGDSPEVAGTVENEPAFVPGVPAGRVSLQGSSGLFNGIFAGNTTYDYQSNATCHRQIEHGISAAHPLDPDDGKRFVHVTWMMLDSYNVEDPDRSVHYDCYDWTVPGWKLSSSPHGGVPIIERGERGGYPCIDIDSEGNAVVFHHSAVGGGSNYSRVTRFAIPGMGIYIADRLTSLPGTELIWTKGVIGDDGDDPARDVYHVAAQDSFGGSDDPRLMAYWRYYHTGTEFVWAGPVLMDSAMTLSHLMLADETRVVLAFSRPRNFWTGRNNYNNDLVYYESTSAGEDWIANNGPTARWQDGGGFNCTDYVDSDPHRAYTDITGGFDSEGRLHLLYNNPAYNHVDATVSVGPCELMHWHEGFPGSNTNAIISGGAPGGFIGGQDQYFHMAASAMYKNAGKAGAWCRNISKMCLAFGDGTTICDELSNLDYLYVTYTQFGSPDLADRTDTSAAGMQNGNIWLSVSHDLGEYWALPECITTVDGTVGGTPTRSPGCDPALGDTCLSEHWSSCSEMVNDTLHVFYVGDLDAGGVVQQEGNWTVNDMMYLPIPGGGINTNCASSKRAYK